MNLIQYNNKKFTLSEINNQCMYSENVIILNNDDEKGIAVMNKELLEKIALSSFLSKGIEDVKNNKLVDGDSFFEDLERRLTNGEI